MLNTRGALVVVLCALAASVLSGCGGARSRYESHMHRGETYYKKGDYSKASVEFRNAMQIEPRDAAARIMTGQSAERLGRVRDAAALYQSVVDSNPENVDARANFARLLAFADEADKAQKILEPAISKHPDNAALLTVRALARLRQQNVAGAIADADRAIQLDPANEQAIALRAGIYRQAGDIEHASILLREGVRRLPDSANLRMVLADLAVIGEHPEEAEAQLREIIARNPKELQYRSQLAFFYARAHKFADARKVLEDAVKVAPESEAAKLNLANFIATQSSVSEAEGLLRGFIGREPDNYSLRLGLGTLIQHFGKMEDAARVYEEVVQLDKKGPSGVIARDRLAGIAAAQGRYDEARRLIEEVLQSSPRDNDALTLRAQLALVRTDPSAAIADLRSVLRDQPSAVGVHRLLARAYLSNGQPLLAVQAFRETLDLAPTDTSLQVELAKVLEQTHHIDEAVSLLENAARKAPTEAPIREALAHAYLTKRDYAAARTAADDLRILQPQAASGYYLAGLAAEGQNRLDDAQASFEHALAILPDGLDSLSALAKLEVRRGQTDRAIALVKAAIARQPAADIAAQNANNQGVAPGGVNHLEDPSHDPSAQSTPSNGGSAPFALNAFRLNLLGELHLTQKNIPLASEALTQATKLTPGWSLPYRNLALARYAAKDVPGAIAAYQSAIKVAPADSQLVAELAELYKRQGRVDDAIASYESLYQRDPRAKAVANNLALLLVTYKKDRASLDRARDLTAEFASSDDGILLDTNGWVHFKRAEYAQALPVLERAADRAPDSKEIRYHLAMAELLTGQKERARKDLEAALSGSATFSGADEARSTLAGLKDRAG